MINNVRYELSFKNIAQLENKLNFCRKNGVNNINIPCKGNLKKEFFRSSIEYIEANYEELNVVFHYSLYHQYTKNKENSYQDFLNFINKFGTKENCEILLLSGSNKKKNFDTINVLNKLKKEEDFNSKIGIAYNPYLKKYFNISTERDRFKKKISSNLIKSIWLQFGTDIKILESEFNYLKSNSKYKEISFFGSIFIPSKEFIARFKFRPWKGVFISEKYLSSLENFYFFTRELIDFYNSNNITPVIESDFFTKEKLDLINKFF